jgi:hypothetical protein
MHIELERMKCITVVTYFQVLLYYLQPGSSVSIESGCRLEDQVIKVRSPAEAKGFFLQSLCPDRLWGSPSLLYSWYGGPFPGAKAQPGCDTDHSPPSSSKVENE